ncbi:hypothetical protein LXL04_029687 [Taraxacum kok-saghyz]
MLSGSKSRGSISPLSDFRSSSPVRGSKATSSALLLKYGGSIAALSVLLSEFRNPVDLDRLHQVFLSEFRIPVDLDRLHQAVEYSHIQQIKEKPTVEKTPIQGLIGAGLGLEKKSAADPSPFLHRDRLSPFLHRRSSSVLACARRCLISSVGTHSNRDLLRRNPQQSRPTSEPTAAPVLWSLIPATKSAPPSFDFACSAPPSSDFASNLLYKRRLCDFYKNADVEHYQRLTFLEDYMEPLKLYLSSYKEILLGWETEVRNESAATVLQLLKEWERLYQSYLLFRGGESQPKEEPTAICFITG